MLTLKDDNGKPLPKKIQKRVNNFIDHLKDVPWFNPSSNLKKEDVEKQVNFTLKCFGVKAGIEYRQLKTGEDWDAARDAALNAARDAALDAEEILVSEKIKDKYPNGAFQQLFKLWEMGLYPVGVLKNKKFVIFVPACSQEFPFK